MSEGAVPARRIPPVQTALEDIIAPSHTALIVWDMQVGIGGRAHNRATLLLRVERLLEAARNAAIMVLWSQHVAPPLEDTFPVGSLGADAAPRRE